MPHQDTGRACILHSQTNKNKNKIHYGQLKFFGGKGSTDCQMQVTNISNIIKKHYKTKEGGGKPTSAIAGGCRESKTRQAAKMKMTT